MNDTNIKREELLSWLYLLVGAMLAAFAVEGFLAPNNVFDGGVVGVSMIASRLSGADLALFILVLNLPFVIIAWRKLGKLFVLKSAFSLMLFSLGTVLLKPYVGVTQDEFLAVTFGGLMLGAGVGLVLKGGGCLDGTEIVAILMSRKTSLSVGQVILVINVVIYVIAGFLFGLDHGMYSLIMYFITSKIIDIVEMGWNSTKAVFIVTSEGQMLANRILQELGRTVTFMDGHGLISDERKDVLYCVITRAEVFEMKRIIDSCQYTSFTTIHEVSEIVGRRL
ncbi:MAG: YitT family protein [Atopobiaceae bacterium]|nr:YitT family protein [Atopobiaceae bacterium]